MALLDNPSKMSEPKVNAITSTTSIEGGDSRGTSLKKQNTLKNYIIATFGEFLGTLLFLSLAFGGTQAVKINHASSTPFPKDPTRVLPTPELLLYESLSAGFSLTVNVWTFYRVTGAFFNPSITFGCVLIGGVPPLKGALMGIAQLVGGIAAAGLVEGLTPGALAVGTSLAPDVSVVQGLFIEVFLTAQLMIAFFLLAVEKHRATFIAPLGIGLCFFTILLFGNYFTGASLNPARSFGPAIIARDFPSYHWIYWIGPTLGASLGAGVYKILLLANYQTVNPGQDDDGLSIVRYEIGQRGTSELADENV